MATASKGKTAPVAPGKKSTGLSAAVQLGTKGGLAKSETKATSSRSNGLKGGKPKAK